MVKHRALGKGLGALIPGAPEMPDRNRDEVLLPSHKTSTLPVNKLFPNPDQPRKAMDEESLKALAESLKVHGIVQPLVVREKDGSFEIVAGERRWRAAQLVGINEVPVTFFEGSDQDAMEVSLIENIQREDLSPLEIAQAILDLTTEFSLTQEEVAKKLGWSRVSITNKLRLLKLPEEVKFLLNNGLLSEGHARALLGLEIDEDRISYARRSVYKMWSVRQLEKTIQERKHNTIPQYVENALEVSPFQKHTALFATRFGLSLRVSGKESNMKLSLTGLQVKEVEQILDILENEAEQLFPGK